METFFLEKLQNNLGTRKLLYKDSKCEIKISLYVHMDVIGVRSCPMLSQVDENDAPCSSFWGDENSDCSCWLRIDVEIVTNIQDKF